MTTDTSWVAEAVRQSVPWVRTVGVRFGEITGQRAVAQVLAELDAGTRPEFTVTVTITDEEGRETSHMTVVWTLRPIR